MNRFFGFFLFALGIAFLILGVLSTQSFSEKFVFAILGRFNDHTLWQIVLGLIMAIGGYLIVSRSPKS